VLARQHVAVGQPRRAEQERSLARREAVGVLVGCLVAQEEVTEGESLLDRRDRRPTRSSSMGRKPTRGMVSREASRSVEP
jgi:hypothetical protein